MKTFTLNSNTLGALASSLCMIHCICTPLLFIAQAGHLDGNHHHAAAPVWWKSLDYIFLVISFFAVYQSTRQTSNKKLGVALWISWAALFLVIINEKLELLHLPEYVTYIAALSLVGLHLYNLKFCQCQDETCCVPE